MVFRSMSRCSVDQPDNSRSLWASSRCFITTAETHHFGSPIEHEGTALSLRDNFFEIFENQNLRTSRSPSRYHGKWPVSLESIVLTIDGLKNARRFILRRSTFLRIVLTFGSLSEKYVGQDSRRLRYVNRFWRLLRNEQARVDACVRHGVAAWTEAAPPRRKLAGLRARCAWQNASYTVVATICRQAPPMGVAVANQSPAVSFWGCLIDDSNPSRLTEESITKGSSLWQRDFSQTS